LNLRRIDTARVGFNNVREECMDVKTEEDYIQLVGRVKCERDNCVDFVECEAVIIYFVE
jgi:hypothetical protein